MVEIYIKFAACVFIGVIIQEVLHWYELSGKLLRGDVKRIFFSLSYFIVFFISSIIITIFIILYVGENIGKYSKADAIVFGSTFPILMKRVVTSIRFGGGEIKLGGGVMKYFS